MTLSAPRNHELRTYRQKRRNKKRELMTLSALRNHELRTHRQKRRNKKLDREHRAEDRLMLARRRIRAIFSLVLWGWIPALALGLIIKIILAIFG